jgi:dTMP kinase
LLAERLVTQGADVLLTREPGGTPLGERVRELLLRAPAGSHDALSDALLFNAARSRLVSEVIRPALDAGAIVICDRFTDSTLAYQGYGGGVPLDALRALAAVATGGLLPHRTVLLDVPVEKGLDRRRAGDAASLTRFEEDAAHGTDFHARVRDGYLALAAEEPARWRIVDGTLDREEVADRVWSAVRDLF